MTRSETIAPAGAETIAPAGALPGALLDALPAMALALGPGGAIEGVSVRLSRALGHEPGELAGRPLAALAAPGEALALEAGGATLLRLRRADGSALALSFEAATLPDGRVLAVGSGPPRDLPDLGHAVRTPMNAILGYAQLLLMGDLGPRQRRHAEAILEAGEHLMALLAERLDAPAAEGR